MSEEIDERLTRAILDLDVPTHEERRALPAELEPGRLERYFDAQLQARHLDFAARWLRQQDQGYYTIGSAGHESNAAVALAVRPTDPALLHYRSSGFYAGRAAQVPGSHGVDDVLRSLAASTQDPISGGRHKVLGSHELSIIPQTSTIGSHLPRAFGIGLTLGRAAQSRRPVVWPADAIVVCTFGDASANHSTAVGALNAAAWCAHRKIPMPILFVCEDNGIGISTRTPEGWIQSVLQSLPSVGYAEANGQDPVAALRTASELADHVRRERSPAVLHLRTVRFMGHAGSDAEQAYRSRTDIVADYAKDPLLATARTLVAAGLHTPEEIVERYERVRRSVMQRAAEIGLEPRLSSSERVREPLTRREPDQVSLWASRVADGAVNGSALPAAGDPLTLAQAINAALVETMSGVEDAAVFGQDVALKGGVYGVTRGLRKRFGSARVFDSLLDEQTILGSALGMAISGWLPIPEIQYLAYLHNALDQIRGEAATQAFFSAGQYQNGMVVRVAGLAYQKGFGGHFHNDNSMAALRDIPGVHVAVPSDADEAVALLRECVALALGEGRVCLFVEPIALYHERDLHESGDRLALGSYRLPDGRLTDLLRSRTHGDGKDLLMVTFGNGVRMSRRVARTLAADGLSVSVLDLRWLNPLPIDDLLAAVGGAERILVVDETRFSGGVSESVISALVDAGVRQPIRRVTSDDSFVPLGPAADTVLLDETQIEQAARQMCADLTKASQLRDARPAAW